jgi:NAD(P)-dependent dehydrogenase (short-subunit alcohol dehydrogenase family)
VPKITWNSDNRASHKSRAGTDPEKPLSSHAGKSREVPIFATAVLPTGINSMSKVILITGASAGLGESMARFLATKGHTVFGTSRKPGQGSGFRLLAMDVTDAASVAAAVAQIIDEAGRLDVLVNNAGLGIAGPVESVSIDDVQRVLDTNVTGLIRTVQAVLPIMRKQGSGTIINISSIGSEMGLPYRGVYSASKAAVDRLTEALRTELAPFGIQACIVQPGGVRTDINKNRLRVDLPADSVYRKSFEKTYELIDESVSGGLSPDLFGELVDRIIRTNHVKRCYRLGKPMEKLSVLLKALLPSATFDKMIRKHYGLTGRPETGAKR